MASESRIAVHSQHTYAQIAPADLTYSGMKQRDTLPDASLASQILPPLLFLVAVMTAMAFGFLLLVGWRENSWPYLLASALAAGVALSALLFRQRRIASAGLIISTSLTFLPILSILAFGASENRLIYLASIGVLSSGLLGSPRMPLRQARLAFLLLLILLLFPNLFGLSPYPLSMILWLAVLMAVVLFGTAALAWSSAHAVRGTIEWAELRSQEAERREQLLRATQTDLERTLQERDQLNQKLHGVNVELEGARAASEAAYRSKANFMATMSHELRTPLNIIIGFSSVMIDHPTMYGEERLPPAILADVEEIRRSGKHLLSLINDILDLARVEAGKLELNQVPLTLTPMLDEMMHTASGLLENRPVLLRREYHAPLPRVLADEVRVRQVLLNLVSNACKFTSAGEIAIGAKADPTELTVWVRDTGIGIAEADQARIFLHFEQVDSPHARPHDGTGLGLSICRWLVELHGGRMWLESEVGKGSIFYFALPRVQSVGSQHASRPASVSDMPTAVAVMLPNDNRHAANRDVP
jgi:signal transduction histidine kinase